jgi:ketosteroid isomerase-like protein
VDNVDVIGRGYEAVAAGDRDALQGLFADGAEWHLMSRSVVAQSFRGKRAVVDYLLGLQDVRLEAIMSYGELVVTAQSFALRSGRRVIATTAYELSNGRVVKAGCTVQRGRRDASPLPAAPRRRVASPA